MNLAFITPGLELSGGTRVIIEYANRLADRGHYVSIVLPKGLEDLITSEVDNHVRIVRTKSDYSRHRSRHSLALALDLATAAPRSDCLVATYAPTVVPTLIASVAMRKGRPYWLYQDYLEMFENRPIEQSILRIGPRFFHRILTISQSCADEIRRHSGKEAIIVGEGLSHQEIFVPYERRDDGSVGKRKKILTLGDIRPRKGLFDFLDAVDIVYQNEQDLELTVVSKDSLMLPTHPPISLCYRPSRLELARLYADCDLFVYAAWWESFGLPPLEAMACGAPVVLTDSRGVREFAVHEQNCLMTEPRNPAALADAIMRILTNPDLASTLSREAIKTAERFDWETPVERFERAILEVDGRSR